MLDQYCVGCHNGRDAAAATASGVLLDRADLGRIVEDGAMWEKVVRALRAGTMPPAGSLRPDAEATGAVLGFVESTLDRAAAERPQPGRILPHRLNRSEYAHAIRDLLAFEVDGAALLPPDDSAHGFDNNAGVLGLSTALVERYLSAASTISALAVGSPAVAAGSETYRVRGDGSQTDHHEGLPFGTRGGLRALHTFPLDGEYVITVKLLEINLGSIRGLEDRHELEIAVDGERVLLAPVGGPEDYIKSSLNATNVVNDLAARLQVRVRVRAGQRPVTAAFLQRSRALGGWRLQPFLRSTIVATDHLGLPHVERLTVTGPFGATGASETPSRARIFVCRPPAGSGGPSADAVVDDQARTCATEIVSTLARRAYRRPVTDADLAPLLAFYETGRREGGFERGIELALRAVLVSPKFLFRVEHDPPDAAPGTAHRIGDLDLASRLSFFLWSSIPDDELIDVAGQGRLHEPAELQRQVRRMLSDPRAQALVENFSGQWLHTRSIRSATPDKNDFPDFDDNLRQAFERELELFVGTFIDEDRSVLDLMTAGDTFVNGRLARHYGIPHVYGGHFRRVTLADDARRGLLGKGGILLLTSHADRTSPVARGRWIAESLMGLTVPPPPADMPPLPEETPGAPQTVRARMDQQRANPACAGCHRVMDPLGLALEQFDAVGAWRDREAGAPVDASAELVDGTRVDGVVALREALVKRPEVLAAAMTEKLLTYALGRGLDHHDMPAVRAIVRGARQDDYRFSSLVQGIVASAPFQMREVAGRRQSAFLRTLSSVFPWK